MSYNMINKLLFFLAVVFSVFILKPQLAEAEESQHFNLVVDSKLGPEEMVNMKCKFQKKSVGVKLVSDLKPIKWDFNVNFSEQTIFKCMAFWQNKYANTILFDKDKEGKTCAKSSTARWEIRLDGFYLQVDDKIWRRLYSWAE